MTPQMFHGCIATLLAMPSLAFAAPLRPAQPQPLLATVAAAQAALSWTDLADLTLASPLLLRVTVADVRRLSRRDAPDVPPGQVRALLTGDVAAAIAAPDLLPARLRWLWQSPVDARGRPAVVQGQPLLLWARPVEGRADQVQLVHSAGQRAWDAETEAAARAVLAEARAGGLAALRVTGVTDGFSVAGGVQGEAESQFFLATGAKPVTLVLLRRPGARPELRLATGDLIDESAAPVRPRTLPWRALACGLPRALPPRLAADPALVRDWATVLETLGPCGRTLG